ncbi:MAG TPA: hypothetical protein VGO67_12085 [Verrucomicrobiae bacterium]
MKDILTVILLLVCLSTKPNADAARLMGVMGTLAAFLLPCVLLTALHDPLLAVFGLKQYALFPTIAVAMCLAYHPHNLSQIFTLFRLIGLSVIITTLVAVAQNRLPAANWLNLSVTGDDMSGFSAGGFLRVSSTFSFVGQYCFYLNALCYGLPTYFYFSTLFRQRGASLQVPVLVGLFGIGMYVTGSRGSVVGNATILGLAGILSAFLAGKRAVANLLVFAALGAVIITGVRSLHPEFFAAYEARSAGSEEVSHRREIEERVKSGLLGWISGTENAPPTLFGYGLGVMTNGSQKLSSYAASWRASGFWTESDQLSTLFEGGWYLVLIWYGFRAWTVIYCFGLLLKIRSLKLRGVACLALGFIIVIGAVGTLGMQPPLAIWWWLAVGLVACLSHFDRVQSQEKTSPRRVQNACGL